MWFVKIPSRSRVNECQGVYSCHSSERVIRDKNVPEFTRLIIIFWNGTGKPQRAQRTQRKQQLSVPSVSSVVNLSHNPITRKKLKSLEFTVKIPSRSRMARLNEFHECPCVGIRVTIEGGI